MDPSLYRGLKYRIDGRTLGQYAVEIYDNEKREKRIIDAWHKAIIDAGLCSSAAVVCSNGLGAIRFAGVSSLPDYVFIGGGLESRLMPLYATIPLELKLCPGLTKVTYKVSNLKSYLKQESYVLTVHVENNEAKNWFLMSPELIERILKERPHENRRELGNKLCVQILKNDFDKYFTINAISRIN